MEKNSVINHRWSVQSLVWSFLFGFVGGLFIAEPSWVLGVSSVLIGAGTMLTINKEEKVFLKVMREK